MSLPTQRPSLRILLVEDSEDDGLLVQAALAAHADIQFDVVRATTLADAFDHLRASTFDAIVLDLSLPDSRGVESITSILGSSNGSPIIVLSGFEDEATAVQAVRLGAQEYLVKSLQGFKQLPRVVRTAIEHKHAEKSISLLANHDSLTNLPNRRLLLDRLTQAVYHARRNGQMVGVLFIDIDHFKTINDSKGHEVGDLVLTAVAKRLRAGVRESDTIARLGGDEFMVILPELSHPAAALALAAKLRAALSQRLRFDGEELQITASIGASLYPIDGGDAISLIRSADAAMYHAKQLGRDRVWSEFAEGTLLGPRGIALATDLRAAIDRGELSLHYQPQIDFGTGLVSGVEALLRWNHPTLGSVPPGAFIPIAEEFGLVGTLSEWVLVQACEQEKTWQRAGSAPPRVAVNISRRHIGKVDSVRSVSRALEETGLAPEHLDLELTEAGVLGGPADPLGSLLQLKALGVRLTLDDFGAGQSSISQLKTFPFNAIKIDQSFVQEATHDPHDAALVRAMIQMAHGLDMTVIGEGVETAEQHAFLRENDCDGAQGFHFSPPMPAEVASEFLVRPKRWDVS